MGLLDTLLAKLTPGKSKDENKKMYFEALVEALEDGVLTNDEIDQLDKLRRQLRLQEDDVTGMKLRAFQVAANAAAADGVVTPQEQRDLDKIKSYLSIEDRELGHTRGTLHKMRMLYEIHKGNLPIVEIAGLALNLGEIAHITEPATLHEDPTGSVRPGATVQVRPGQPFKMGAGRSAPMPEGSLQQAATGTLTITNQRILYNTGVREKTFGATYARLESVLVYTDGFGFLLENAPARYVRVANKKEIELIAGVISRFMNPPPPKDNNAKPAPGGPRKPSK
jgi:hypothetical protein